MNQNPSDDDWEQIKLLASKLQAISNLLESFGEPNSDIKLNQEIQIMQEQLKIDFNEAMTQLIDIIEKYD